ncbi:sigma factor [Mycobacterium dioxanotrophicus]
MHLVKQTDVPKDLPELLTAEQEVELAKRIEAGLYAQFLLAKGASPYTPAQLRLVAADGQAAFEHFVTANVRLSAWWARKRAVRGASALLTVEDLTAEGMLGVIRAVQKFDYTQGFKFSTYALHWVRLHQQRAIAKATPAALSSSDQARCRELLMVTYQLGIDLGSLDFSSKVIAVERWGKMGREVASAVTGRGGVVPYRRAGRAFPGPVGLSSVGSDELWISRRRCGCAARRSRSGRPIARWRRDVGMFGGRCG